METRYSNNLRSLLLSVLFLMAPVIIWGLWIYVFETNPSASQFEKAKIYDSYFPVFMQGNLILSLIVLVSSLIAIVMAGMSMSKTFVSRKIISILIIIAASLIVLLQLFSMM
jgi:hypothetical protein